MTLPNFLIIGAQKAGTSTLHHNLSKHPNVLASKRKELHFFDDNFGIKTLDNYKKQFKNHVDQKVIFESTPSYMIYPGAADKIREVLGDVKIAIILRHPVDRMHSHYLHEIKLGWEHYDFEVALEKSESRRQADPFIYYRHYNYIQRSLYGAQLRKIRGLFSAVHILRFEDMVSSPLDELASLCDFLGIDRITHVDAEIKNEAKVPRFKGLSRIVGNMERYMGEGFRPAAFIRWVNNRRAQTPKLSEYERNSLYQLYFADDPVVREFYPLVDGKKLRR